jgi:hypothetical protein
VPTSLICNRFYLSIRNKGEVRLVFQQPFCNQLRFGCSEPLGFLAECVKCIAKGGKRVFCSERSPHPCCIASPPCRAIGTGCAIVGVAWQPSLAKHGFPSEEKVATPADPVSAHRLITARQLAIQYVFFYLLSKSIPETLPPPPKKKPFASFPERNTLPPT